MNTLKNARLELVLDRIKALANESSGFMSYISDTLNMSLDEMKENGYFGENGESDPRGNQSEGDWSMHEVQGVDDL